MYIILLCIREMDEHTCYILSLLVSSFNISPNSQHDIKKYIINPLAELI